MIRTEVVQETSVIFNELMRLIALEYFINFSHCASSRSYISNIYSF
jgi:hypothetical protein